MRRSLGLALLLGVWCAPSAAWADRTEIEQLVMLLSEHESMPEPSVFVSRRSTTPDLLYAIYADRGQPTFVRVRALRAIGHFGAVAAPRLEAVVTDPKARAIFVREAALALVRCAGDAAMAPVVALLARNDARLRRIATEALGVLATPAAREHLRAQLRLESDLSVRALLDAALQPDNVTP